MGFDRVFLWLLWLVSRFVEISMESVACIWVCGDRRGLGCCLVSRFGGGMVASFLWLWLWCLFGFFMVVLWVLWVEVVVGFLWQMWK